MLRLKPFELKRPNTLGQAIDGLDETAMLIAGGSDLVPKLKRGQFEPRTLVSLRGVPGLDALRVEDGELVLGAMLHLRDLERSELLDAWPMLREAVRGIATPTIRENATVGGNLCQDTRCHYIDRSEGWRAAAGYCMKKGADICRVAPSSPRCHASFCSDLAPALVALDAHVTLHGAEERTLPLAQLYRDDGMDHLALDGAVLTAVRVPAQPRIARYRKLALRGSFDFPELGIAVALGVKARVAMTAVASFVPWWETEFSRESREDFAARILSDLKPLDTLWFPPDYRKAVARNILRELLSAA